MARRRSERILRVLCGGAVALQVLGLDAADLGRKAPCVITDLNASYPYPSLEPTILVSKTTGTRGQVTPMLVVPRSPPVASTKKQAASKQSTVQATQAQTPGDKLMDAIGRGDLPGVQRLLATRSMDPRGLRDAQGEWAIWLAAQLGSPEISRELIRYGAPLRPDNDMAKGGDLSPVLEATGSLAVLLRAKDKESFRWTRFGATPARYLETIQLLLESGGDPNEISQRYPGMDPSNTPLRRLIEMAPSSPEEVQAARLLLEHGALISFRGHDLLSIAAVEGKNELVEEILRQRKPTQESLDTAYLEAIRTDHLEAAALVLAAGANANARGYDSQSILWRAMVPTLNRERVAFLLSHGVDVNDVPPGSKAPLVLALYDDALMRAIIRAGANLNARDAFGKTALRLAVEPPTTVSREIGDETPITTKYPGLDRAARLRTVKLLLESGADPNLAASIDGFTPLMRVGPSEPELLDVFLEHGATVNVSASDMVEYHRGGIDVGPVTWAVLHDNEPLALRVLNRAGRIDASDCGVVYYAAARADASLLEGLRRAGANFAVVESRDSYSPLMAAAAKGSVATVKVLLADSRIDVNYRTPIRKTELKGPYSGKTFVEPDGGVSALMVAAQAGHADVVSLLLARGANVNVMESRDNYTPLMAVAASGNIPTAQALLADSRIDVNLRTPVRRTEFKDPVSGLPVIVVDGGLTALMVAAQYEAAHPGVVSLLLGHGADAHQTDAKGQSSMDYARGAPSATQELLRKAAGRQSP